ncbi:hypothetical protein [Allokutzneria multivorans]
METWRMIATGVFALGGLVLVLVAMAQVRDRKHSTRAQVTQTGLIALAVLSVVTALIATVLPETIAWALVAFVVLIVLTLTMVG